MIRTLVSETDVLFNIRVSILGSNKMHIANWWKESGHLFQ